MRIFLTGLPGAGKTYLGGQWASQKAMEFYDLDTLIENEERMPVEKIFSVYGEGYFREKEAAVLRNTDRFDNCIIACGGGTPCFFDNMSWMNRNGVTVFLDKRPENIFKHLMNENKPRPLLPAGNEALKIFIKEKSTERFGYYIQSQIRLEGAEISWEGFQKSIALIEVGNNNK